MKQTWSSIDLSIKVSVGLLLLLLLVSFISRVATRPGTTSTRSTEENVKQFVKESVRFHAMAIQDAHYVNGLTHINQAISYMNSARSIAPNDQKIEEWTSVEPKEWLAKLDDQQAKIIAKMQAQCPNEFTKNPYMQYAGWT